MIMKEITYEVPFETEDSYGRKIEKGLIKQEKKKDTNWIPDTYFEERSE